MATLGLAFVDPRWAAHMSGILCVLVATVALRARPIQLTKYSTLTGSSVAGLSGALMLGVSAGTLGLYAGVLLGDWMVQRKALAWAWVNAGRESLALIAAYGAYAALALQLQTGTPGAVTAEGVPAIADFFFSHFLVSRALQYFSLVLRRKLQADERSLILRYEVITFAATVAAVVVTVLTVAFVGPAGWAVVAIALGFAALLFTRIIE